MTFDTCLLEKEIESYFSSFDFNKLDDPLSGPFEKMFERFDKDKLCELFGEKKRQGIKLNQMPEFHDIYESVFFNYDCRVKSLISLVFVIDSLAKENKKLKITDAGCATGLDILFLAKHYKNSEIKFNGYDYSSKMISLANEKKNKLDLKKVNFYVSDHNFPKSSEKESCNFLYINSPKNVRWRNEAFSYRIAKKGVFLLGKVAFNDSEYSFFNNFTFQKRQEIISFDGLKYENCIFNKKEV